MRFSTKALTLAIAMVGSGSAIAVELSTPKAYGFLSAGALKTETKDFEAEAFELEVGILGYATLSEDLKLNYALELDLAPAANAADTSGQDFDTDVKVKEAKFWLPTDYGMFVVAPKGTSGHWAQLYGPVDTFEYNEARAFQPYEQKPAIFALSDRTSGTFAYWTPKFLNTQVVVSAITLNEANKQDADVKAIRIIYQDDMLHLGLGTAVVAEEELPPFVTDDYQVTTASAGITFGQVKLGAVWEHNDQQPFPAAAEGSADSDAYGVSISYAFENGYGLSTGYRERDHDFDVQDESAYLLKLERRITEQVKVWAETGQYEEGNSNYAAGFNIIF